MKFRQILQEHYATIATIIAIIVTVGLSFADRISDEDALKYLLCADAALAIDIFFVSLKNEKSMDSMKLCIDSLVVREEPHSSKKVTRKEHYQLLNSAALNAKREIRIMTIDPSLQRSKVKAIPEREIYYKTIEMIASKKPEIIIERIYGIPKNEPQRRDKIEWVKSDLVKFKNCPNYHMFIFDWKKFNSIPTPLSLQIIDDTFLGLVNMQHPVAGIVGTGEDICINDPNIVQHLQLYYETIREKCDTLKLGESIDEDILNNVLGVGRSSEANNSI